MAHTQHSEFSSMTAAADYRTNQYFGVTQTGDQQVTLAGANAVIFGVLNNKPNSGETAEVIRANSGVVAKVKLGGTVARRNPLTTDSAGKFVVATTGQNAAGYAMSAGVANDIIEIEFAPHTV